MTNIEIGGACDWQGYGFGASYEDAGCCGGEIGDLDDCEVPGGPIGLRGESCPQCHGTGKLSARVNPMALIRQRELATCQYLCDDIEDVPLADMLRKHFQGWHDLVVQLENGKP